MSVKPVPDRGQEIEMGAGRVIGYADTLQQGQAVADVLIASGVPKPAIALLVGDAGIEILNRTLGEFFFGDGEDSVLVSGLEELRNGHVVIDVRVHDREEAVRIVNLAAGVGGRTFTYFGTLMNEQLS